MSSAGTYLIRIEVPRQLGDEDQAMSREEFYSAIWARFGENGGLVGIHEGTVLSEEAAEQGLETESFTLDAAEAPRERDWIGGQRSVEATLYFTGRAQAERFVIFARRQKGIRIVGEVEEQPERDWDREWKASFMGSVDGVRVPPDWRILPPWVSNEEARLESRERALRINPGAGFGTGTHETTQLCLQVIAESISPNSATRVLDFGSGSGILSIGAALRDARVWAVEIDPLANDNASDNAHLNGVAEKIQISRKLEEMTDAPRQFDLVVANILRPVLEAFADELVGRLTDSGRLILSGLVAEDVERIVSVYGVRLGKRSCRVLEKGEWRCLVW